MHPKFIKYLDVNKIELLYNKLILIELEDLPKHKQDYVNGALDGCLSALGINTPLLRILDIPTEISKEEMIEAIKINMRNAYPDSEEITSGYTDDKRISELEQYYSSMEKTNLPN